MLLGSDNDVPNDNDVIPDQLWKLLPNTAMYLRNIMEFAGYTTRDAVLRLRDGKELRKMLDFAIEMSDVIEDKQKYFGIFAKKPEKVRVLPGLEAVFKKFLDSVAANKHPSSRIEITTQAISLKKEKPSTISVTCETLVDQMLQWCKKKGHDGRGKIKIEKSPPNKYIFTCICNEKIVLSVTKNAVSLSNVQRHIKDVCWMAEKPPNPKRPRKSSTIQKFFPPEATLSSGKPVLDCNLSTQSSFHTNNQSSTHETVLSSSNLETGIPLAAASSSSESDLPSFKVTVDISDNESSKN